MTTTEPTATDSPASAPLDFDPYSEVFFNDPYAVYQRLRDEAPAFRSERHGGFYVLSRFEDVSRALKDSEVYSSAYGIDVTMVNKGEHAPIPMMIMMDPPDHDRMRSLVSKVFTPRAISALEPMIREIQTRYLAATAGRDDFDVVAEYSDLFPLEVITTMLGVPAEHGHRLKKLLEQGLHREPGQVDVSEDNVAAMTESGILYYEITAAKRKDPADDMISRLIAAEYERPDGSVTQLDDIEITGFISLLAGAGAETVTKAIGNAAVQFSAHPDQWERLVADPSLIPAAVEEVLRFEPPSQYVVRRTTQEVEVHGTTIPAESAVLISMGAAARDERQYEGAAEFDILRKPTQAVSLGYGVHSCLGAALARLECRIALQLLAARMPHFAVETSGLRRVSMSNVAGYCNVPVTVGS